MTSPRVLLNSFALGTQWALRLCPVPNEPRPKELIMSATKNARELTIAVSSILMLSAPLSHAQPGNGGGRHGPPPEAIEACSGKSENDSCSFSGRRGTVEGSCIVPPREETLACAPEGGPPEHSEHGRMR